MDLVLKVGIGIVVVILIISAGFLLTQKAPTSGQLNSTQAKQLVLNDVKASNPNATVTVISVMNSTLEANSWSIILSVVYNATKPCPTLLIEGYDYPATGFVPTQDNVYTRGCIIYGLSTAPSYVISSPEIAIARSYNATTAPALYGYVKDFGYNSTFVHATFYSNLGASMTPLDMQYSNAWLVNYSAIGASYNQYGVLAQNGQLYANYTMQK